MKRIRTRYSWNHNLNTSWRHQPSAVEMAARSGTTNLVPHVMESMSEHVFKDTQNKIAILGKYVIEMDEKE